MDIIHNYIAENQCLYSQFFIQVFVHLNKNTSVQRTEVFGGRNYSTDRSPDLARSSFFFMEMMMGTASRMLSISASA